MNNNKIIRRIMTCILDFKKPILIFFCFFVGIILLMYIKYIFSSYPVYYLHKDKNYIMDERITVKEIGSESKVQAFLRAYLSGSNNYQSKIPFNHEVRLLSVSHSQNGGILVLNWNSYFYKILEQSSVNEEITLLLLSLKKNFNIESVYFLVEGSRITVTLDQMDLGQKISLDQIKI